MANENCRRSRDDAGRSLRECLQEGKLHLTHCFGRQLETAGLSIIDAQIIIRRGTISDEPERDVSTGEWKYQIFGTAPEGEFVTILFCFDHRDEAVLIAVSKG
jgi:hypothetical protein